MCQGAWLVAGSGAAADHDGFAAGERGTKRTTASTTSSMYVKSRRIRPWLNSLIGRPCKIASRKSHIAMSGRPHGPYTVKKRKPVAGRAKRCA